MRILVLHEINDLNVMILTDRITNNESRIVQALEHIAYAVCVHIVITKDRLFDFARSVFEPALTIGQTPEANEEKARQRRQIAQNVVVKKSRFYAPCSGHSIIPSTDVNLSARGFLNRLAETASIAIVRAQM